MTSESEALWKRWSARLQFCPQGAVVVDLAIEDQHDLPILAEHRLLATLHIDDGEAAHAQHGLFITIDAAAIRAAMPDRRIHGFTDRLFGDRPPLYVEQSDDAAHLSALQRVCDTAAPVEK
jgi:hypothetical protein